MPCPSAETLGLRDRNVDSEDDPTRDLQRSVEALQVKDPMKDLRVSMKMLQMNDPLKDVRESMKALKAEHPFAQIRHPMAALQAQDPMKEIRESVMALQMQGPLKEIRESIKVLQMRHPLEEFRESMLAVQAQDPLKEFRESMRTLQMRDPFKEVRDALGARPPRDSLGELVKGISDHRWSGLLEGHSEIAVRADGQVSIGAVSVSQTEVQGIARQVIDDAFDEDSRSIEEQIDRILVELRALREPAVQRILAWLIYPVIVGLVLSVVNPVAEFYIKGELSSGDKRQVVKDVSKAITSEVDAPKRLRSFRVVTATALNVRQDNSTKSTIVGTLHLGDVVEIVEKKRKWALVRWESTDGNTSMRGWVYSRYLRIIK